MAEIPENSLLRQGAQPGTRIIGNRSTNRGAILRLEGAEPRRDRNALIRTSFLVESAGTGKDAWALGPVVGQVVNAQTVLQIWRRREKNHGKTSFIVHAGSWLIADGAVAGHSSPKRSTPEHESGPPSKASPREEPIHATPLDPSQPDGSLQVSSAEESELLEFKSSAYYSYREGVPERVILRSVLKTVAGFLNSRGGTLVVGVADDGTVLGVEPDLEHKGMDLDRYVNALTTAVESHLGSMAATLTSIRAVPRDGRTVCILEIEESPGPVFSKEENNSHAFHVRINNSTRKLDGPSLIEYVRHRWG